MTVLNAAQAARDRGGEAQPDVRVIASTSAPLSAASGFHTKLLALLERRQLRVPSLAERSDDVPELAMFFVRQHARRIGAVVETIGAASLNRLRKYRWPGDLGELQSLMERAVTSAREPVLEIDATQLDEGVPLGLYRLMEKLGEGGMGEVWRARHQLLARPCAVKVIRPDRLGESNREKTIARFRLEAQDHRATELAQHRASLRLRRDGNGQPLLRHGAARRTRPRLARAAVRPFPAGARADRAAAGLPIAGRGARRRPAASGHQAAQPPVVPARA